MALCSPMGHISLDPRNLSDEVKPDQGKIPSKPGFKMEKATKLPEKVHILANLKLLL